MKIVIVDDSAPDRRLCRLLLEEARSPQLELIEEDSAEGGLEICRSVAPDCVLLDYRLPDMTGLEFLQRLREDNLLGTAVVMLTGLASEQVAVEAMKAGAQDYLVKDRMTAEGLSLAIQKAMQKAALQRDLKEERDRLARSLAEKEVLVKEVHHRVKNNLAVVASLLRMQAEGLENERAADALRQSQHRVESMALIHEQLYQSGNLREIDLASHAALLMSNLFHAYGVDPARISGHAAISGDIVLGIHKAIPAGLILNELISNALKHAFPDGCGSITVEGSRSGDRITLAVRDDGVGPPAALLSGGAPESGAKPLGLRIVRILVRQLKGDLEIGRNGAGRGAVFRISFPAGKDGER